MEEQPQPIRRRRSVKDQIARRTTSSEKLVALEARKVAIGELVAEQLDTITAMLEGAGFKVSRVKPPPQPDGIWGAVPPPAVASAAPPEPPKVKNPCALCGNEAHGTEGMPDGSKRFLCRAHFAQRAREQREEAESKAILGGNEGTMFARRSVVQPPVAKTVIQHPATPDPFKGPFPNGAEPPANKVLDDPDIS